MSEQWADFVNAIIYMLHNRALDDRAAANLAQSFVQRPLWDLTREHEYKFMTEAIRSGGPLPIRVSTTHTESDIRTFIAQLASRMDELRPWPPLPFQQLPLQRWQEAQHTEMIARIDRGFLWLQNVLVRGFVTDENTNCEVLPLQLPSGAEVAFVWPSRPGGKDTALVRLNAISSPEQLVNELLSVTTMAPGRITLVSRAKDPGD